jgi:predicted permease
LLERLNALPGVEAAGGTSCLPLSCREAIRFRIDGTPVPDQGERPTVEFRNVTPEYFRTLRIRLLRGRFFTNADVANALPVAIVNESFSRRFFANQDPVGRRILAGGSEAPSEIVGVVSDIRHGGLAQGPTPEMYWPYAQNGRGAIRLAVRTTLPPSALVPEVRRTIAALAPGTVVDSVSTLESAMDRNLAPRYFATSMIVCFAFVALLLAAAGVYGVMSYSVAQRTREIGLRVALGAQRHEITRLVMRQSAVVTAAGLGFGLPVAFVLSRVINRLLYATSPFDPLTLVGVSVLLGLVSLTASYLPARRALQLDPMAALRCE